MLLFPFSYENNSVKVYRVVCGKFVKYLTPPEGEAVAREHFAEMLKNFPHSEPPPAESGAMFFRSGRTSPEDNEADDERYLEGIFLSCSDPFRAAAAKDQN